MLFRLEKLFTRLAPSWFIVALLYAAMIHDFTTIGMSLDGTVYAAISRLLAFDHGSFWQLPFYISAFEPFTEHPPLGPWVGSQFFLWFGDQFFVEKLLPAVAFGLATLGFTMIWHRLHHGFAGLWLGLLAFASMPLLRDVVPHNYLECLLLPLVLFSSWLLLGRKHVVVMALLAGIFIVLGALVKGPVAFFPLAVPLLASFTLHHHSWSKGILATLVTLLTTGIILTLIFLQPEPLAWLNRYWESQILASISGDRPAIHGRLYLVQKCAKYLFIATLVVVIAVFLGHRHGMGNGEHRQQRFRVAFFLFLVALAASAPLLVSARQFKHYLLPALPFYAMMLGSIAHGWLGNLKTLSPRVARGLNAVAYIVLPLLMLGLGSWHWGTIGKDEEELGTAKFIAQTVTDVDTVGFCFAANDMHQLQAYLSRYYSLRSVLAASPNETSGSPYQICDSEPGGNFVLVSELDLAPLKIYIREDN